MHVDYELAEVLTEQYNSYACMMEDMDELEVDWVLDRLVAAFDPEDLKFLIEDDFGRGCVMGQLRLLLELERASDDETEG